MENSACDTTLRTDHAIGHLTNHNSAYNYKEIEDPIAYSTPQRAFLEVFFCLWLPFFPSPFRHCLSGFILPCCHLP